MNDVPHFPVAFQVALCCQKQEAQWHPDKEAPESVCFIRRDSTHLKKFIPVSEGLPVRQKPQMKRIAEDMLFKYTRRPRKLVRQFHLSVELDGEVLNVTCVKLPTAYKELIVPASIVGDLSDPVLRRVNVFTRFFMLVAVDDIWVVHF